MGIKSAIRRIVFKLMSECTEANKYYFNQLLINTNEINSQLNNFSSNFNGQMQRVSEIEGEFAYLNEKTKNISDELAVILNRVSQQDEAIALIQDKINASADFQERISIELHRHIDYLHQDIFSFLSQTTESGNPLITPQVRIATEHPVAIHSNDHLHPRGTANDNTRAPFFIRKCEELFPNKKLKYMDIGCAGGGLVLDALLRGHFAIGLEGSDYSLLHQRAEWRALRNNLFTCDVTYPFEVKSAKSDEHIYFDVISAWEVLEHIPEECLDQMIDNIVSHLEDGGIFVGTAAQFEDYDPISGASMHVTIRPQEWWEQKFTEHGLVCKNDLFEAADMARAWGNPPLPWLTEWKPERSPYIVMQKIEGDKR